MNRPVVLLDCGDTLVDEATEVKDGQGVVLKAQWIPGADQLVRDLAARGWVLGLVADGPVASFRNVLGQAGLWELFRARAISEEVGAEKPDPRMFLTALEHLGIPRADWRSVVMVGNNLERDIAGANALGLVSVWMSWSPRRRRVPLGPLEVPRYQIGRPDELIPLVERLQKERAVLSRTTSDVGTRRS